MKLAIVTDSTCDLTADTLKQLDIWRVPLYVHFKGETKKDWIEINPSVIVEGVREGADMPSTSQPSPQDFTDIYQQIRDTGADQILCLTISSGLSGTYQSATIAAKESDTPVTVFDSRATSVGLGMMVRRAAALRDQDKPLGEIMKELERIRDKAFIRFSVDSLDFLRKNGRIGGASALLGSLLNLKPILTVVDGKVEPAGRARGNKRALKEVVDAVEAYANSHGRPVVHFLHVLAEESAGMLRDALDKRNIRYVDAGTYQIGAVVASHVGPGTYGLYAYPEPS
ncbi:MAG: DegV family protein [Trueperaceae bacterium]|nr:DegV family protein [Trueperaceae bacterium]